MKEIKPSKELQFLLNRGGVSYVLMEPEVQTLAKEELHREAAIFFIETQSRRIEDMYEREAKWLLFRLWCFILRKSHRPEDRSYHITFDPTKAVGYPIDVPTFVGIQFCIENDLPLSYQVRGQRLDDKYETGYWDAFSDPPYSLSETKDEIQRLFHAINDQLFGGLDESLDIFEWSTGWSNYFDEGQEWWGSYLWTIYSPKRNSWVAIGASDTD